MKTKLTQAQADYVESLKRYSSSRDALNEIVNGTEDYSLQAYIEAYFNGYEIVKDIKYNVMLPNGQMLVKRYDMAGFYSDVLPHDNSFFTMDEIMDVEDELGIEFSDGMIKRVGVAE